MSASESGQHSGSLVIPQCSFGLQAKLIFFTGRHSLLSVVQHGGHGELTELNPGDGSVSLFNRVIAGVNERSGLKVHRWESAQLPQDRRGLLGVVLCYQVTELLDDGVHELLSVSVRLPELCKHVVLSVALPHSAEENERVMVRGCFSRFIYMGFNRHAPFGLTG